MVNELFEDTFIIDQINPEGRKFKKVDRIICKGETYEMELTLDIHNQLYKCKEGDKFRLVLAKSLGESKTDTYVDEDEPSLMDSYDYVMHGQVFRAEKPKNSQKIEVYASFGGLLMNLQGEARNVGKIELDMEFYLLMRATGK